MLILIRGIPGSGKSTYAKKLLETTPKSVHFEADDFWIRHEFDPKYLHLAHKQCQENAKEALEGGYTVIVANTFTRLWEMEPYLSMSDNISVFRMTGEYGSVNNVPQKTIDKMKKRFEDYIGEIYV